MFYSFYVNCFSYMASKVPPSLRAIGSYVKIANENASRDPVVYYWCLFYAVQNAMQLDKSSPEALQFITGLLGTLEAIKKQLAGQDAIANEVVAQAHLESFALKLFNYADQREKSGNVDKAVVHAFYTAGHLMDVLALFGEIDENIASTKKYAKWKCMQINQCIRDGTPYVSSSTQDQDTGDDNSQFGLEQPGNSNAFAHAPQPAPDHSNFAAHNEPHGYSTGPQIPSHGSTASLPNPIPASRTVLPAQIPVVPSASASTSQLGVHGTGKQPSLSDFAEARKFTKYALSAIDYEDTQSVIENLTKALALMR